MKKIFAFAIAAVALTVGCQKNQIESPEVDPLDDGTPVPVVFGTNVATVSTKAAVEGREELLPFHVYGIDNAAEDLTATEFKFLLDEDITDGNTYSDGYTTTAYYGANKETYSFYGYYVGGLTVTPVMGTNTITIPVTITGQEDLMIGMTNKENDLNARPDKSQTLVVEDLYSAKSARRTVKPNLVFDHKLVRFDFKFTDGSKLNEEAAPEKSVWVEKVEVTSHTAGELVITHDATAPEDTLIVKGTAGTLTLGSSKPTQDDPENPWAPLVQFGLDPTPALVDDAVHGTIMVMPIPEAAEGGEAPKQEYALKLYLNQTGATEAVPQDLTLAMGEGKEFEAGKKYTVNITVYGLEAVIVDVTVNDWTPGGSFTYDPDDTDSTVTPDEPTVTP